MDKFKLLCLIFIITIINPKEGHVSGSASGAVGTKWYSLLVTSKLRMSPMGGDYSNINKEGDGYEEKLKPLRINIEKIVLEAKNKFNAPIIFSDASKIGDSIYGIIIEDEMEFDPDTDLSYKQMSLEEKIKSEKKAFKERQNDEVGNAAHCEKNFKKGSIQSVTFSGTDLNLHQEYHVTLWVNARVKRSTLNWIKKQIHPLLMEVFPKN